ncbi:uncharacterized protein LOC128222713 [Mya arenaria]|uniref:uncharacterized protein LOC128222713 n=1 Tax=Mya arenaria TaxID=6604 RepID=UPI0022E21C93|nr:uncharacterized protein LOC128222713 [Mya arenaria]
MNLHLDQFLEDKHLGVYDVHIENLVAPDNCRAIRHVDPHHVGFLADSFAETKIGQLVVLQGMVLDRDVDPATLHQLGAGKVECLGGNHTRQALQTLYHEGRWKKDSVKVNVFRELTREAALSLGYQHNVVLHERKKAVSFLDKVRMMRHLRPEETMSAAQVKTWKDSLILVFKAKDRRKLQQRWAHHLLMAQLPDEIWAKVLRSTQLIDVNERFFKQMMKLSQACIPKCLSVLEESGPKAFNVKVKEFIAENELRSGQPKLKTPSQPPTPLDEENRVEFDGDADLFDDIDHHQPDIQPAIDYRQKYEALLVKHENLKKEMENVKKQKREEHDFQVGEAVQAKWTEKGKSTWLSAKVIGKDLTLDVDWDCDKKVSSVSPIHLRRL